MWKWSEPSWDKALFLLATTMICHNYMSLWWTWKTFFLQSRKTILCYFSSIIMLKFQLSCHSVLFVSFYYSLNWQKEFFCALFYFLLCVNAVRKKCIYLTFKKRCWISVSSVWRFLCHKYSEQNNCCFVLCSWERTAWSNRAGLFQRLSVDCYFDVETILFCLIEQK